MISGRRGQSLIETLVILPLVFILALGFGSCLAALVSHVLIANQLEENLLCRAFQPRTTCSLEMSAFLKRFPTLIQKPSLSYQEKRDRLEVTIQWLTLGKIKSTRTRVLQLPLNPTPQKDLESSFSSLRSRFVSDFSSSSFRRLNSFKKSKKDASSVAPD